MSSRRTKLRIEDVVKATGFSRATIDRVLNERPGVRAETKHRVELAMEALGYAPNALAAYSAAKTLNVDVILPTGSNPFFAELQKGLRAATGSHLQTNLNFRFSDFDAYTPETLIIQLHAVKEDCNAVIVLGIDTYDAKNAIDTLVNRGVRVITVVSDAPRSHRHLYVGQDNFAAGRTAGRLMSEMIPGGTGAVAVMLGHFQFRHLLDRHSGFQQVMATNRPDLRVITAPAYGADAEASHNIASDLMRDHADLRGIYIGGGGQPRVIQAVSEATERALVTIAHELTPLSTKALASGAFRMILAHDVYEVARKAVDAVLDVTDPRQGACGINIYVTENLPFSSKSQ